MKIKSIVIAIQIKVLRHRQNNLENNEIKKNEKIQTKDSFIRSIRN